MLLLTEPRTMMTAPCSALRDASSNSRRCRRVSNWLLWSKLHASEPKFLVRESAFVLSEICHKRQPASFDKPCENQRGFTKFRIKYSILLVIRKTEFSSFSRNFHLYSALSFNTFSLMTNKQTVLHFEATRKTSYNYEVLFLEPEEARHKTSCANGSGVNARKQATDSEASAQRKRRPHRANRQI